MSDVITLRLKTLQARKRNDVWALGKVIFKMALVSCDAGQKM